MHSPTPPDPATPPLISRELLDVLRCPFDPRQTRLEAEAAALVCTRCGLRFPIKDGIPCMLVEGAELPPGCKGLSQLPCRQNPPAGDRA